jgi:molecular chaperone Hsp33
MNRHQLAPTATAALGRTLLGAALLGAFRKEEEKLQIQFRGDGPLGGILAVADTQGQVKGKVGACF